LYTQRDHPDMNSNVFGWLGPRGKFYACKAWDHIKSINDHADLVALVPDYESIKSEVNSARELCQSLENAEEHGEWHHYEMAVDDANAFMTTSLYQAGCLRVGSVGDRMSFEGTSSAIKQLYQVAINLAESHGKTPAFEPFYK
jgi:hypothetical protein